MQTVIICVPQECKVTLAHVTLKEHMTFFGSSDEGLGIWYSCHRNNYYFSMRLDSMDFALELVVKRGGG